VSHIQYVDGTLFIGEAFMANLWAMKTTLRCFDLASSLKVSFAKNSIMGVNVDSNILSLAEGFLH